MALRNSSGASIRGRAGLAKWSASDLAGSSGGGGGGGAGDFDVVVLGSPDFQIIASAQGGSPIASGTFDIPTAGTYTATITGLSGSERGIAISDGSVTKTGDSSPFTVTDEAVGDLVIVAGSDGATVTVS